ncbi:MAG: hypothetical protein QM675_02115 [Protaetiibacter sp.]
MPSQTAPHPARASHSHLFPGATILVEGEDRSWAEGGRLDPIGLDILFSDGATTTAELLVAEGREDAALEVEAYRTSAGTELPRAVWRVREAVEADGRILLRLGAKLAGV